MEKTFDTLWHWINSRGSVITVQQREELEHVFNLMRDCECQSYLEVGTAEGNSLYVLGHAVSKSIRLLDLCEDHTRKHMHEIVDYHTQNGKDILIYAGDSTYPETFFGKNTARFITGERNYDCILIDGGHDFATVLSDSILYVPLATKYVFWHDIQLPEVRAAVEWFCKRWQLGEYNTFINSDSFGYGVLKVK